MKKTIGLFILFLSNYCIGQTDFYVNFNSTESGRNVSFALSKTFGKNEFGGGLRYTINAWIHPDDQDNVYYKRLYARNFAQHMGISGFYHHHIFHRLKIIDPFLFYDLQASYASTWNRMTVPPANVMNGGGEILTNIQNIIAPDGTNVPFETWRKYSLFEKHRVFFGPFYWVEQYIGLGYKAHLTGNLYIVQKIGFGTSFILGYEKKMLSKYWDWFEWEFGGLLNAGIIYRIK